MRRNYWLALSFANLVYLRAWTDLLPVRSDALFFRKALPGIGQYFGIACDVLALSLLTILVIDLAPKLPGWLQRLLPIAAITMVALAIRSTGAEGTVFLRAGLFRFAPPKVLFSLAASVATVAAGLAFRFSAVTLRLARVCARAALPCLAVTFAGTLASLSAQRPLPPDPPLAPRLGGSPPVRVIWIIFDEWDEHLSFGNRAPGTLLPAIDNLAGRSFTATRALAVQGDISVPEMSTIAALPSLLYGRLAVDLAVEDAVTMRIHFADGSSQVLGGGDSIFARMHSHGWNSALAGWYLPYCRVFDPLVTHCYWEPKYEQQSSSIGGVLNTSADETRMLFETSLFSVFGPSLVAKRHAAEYDALLAAARRDVADPSIGLTFIHFNIPHTPYFHSPHGAKSRGYGYSAALYENALELVDSSVRDILTSLHSSGLDPKTAIILSSDHPARFATRDGVHDSHVPFFVHLPGETAGTVSGREFSTVKTADLAMAIAQGEVKSASDIMFVLGIASVVSNK